MSVCRERGGEQDKNNSSSEELRCCFTTSLHMRLLSPAVQHPRPLLRRVECGISSTSEDSVLAKSVPCNETNIQLTTLCKKHHGFESTFLRAGGFLFRILPRLLSK